MNRPARLRTWALACYFVCTCMAPPAHTNQPPKSIEFDWTKRAILHQLVAENMHDEVRTMLDGHKGKWGQKNRLADTPNECELSVRYQAPEILIADCGVYQMG